jgi:hypothetical protein
MGAGASTEGFSAEAALGDGDSTEFTAEEGYDSDLAGDLKDLFSARVVGLAFFHFPSFAVKAPVMDTQ